MLFGSIPVESIQINGKRVVVYRADLAPKPPLAPYLKMVELYPYLQTVSKRYKLVGYYAVPESEWVVSVPSLAAKLGMSALIGLNRCKKMPSYANAIPHDCLLLLKPNIYRVNYSIMKNRIEALSGLMLPMGLECAEVVNGLTSYLSEHPIPKTTNLVVPTGSGVALSGILNHLKGRATVYGICTRPIASVFAVVKKYVRDTSCLHLIDGNPNNRDDVPTPFPTHPFWDRMAFNWLWDNAAFLSGSTCFVNLGSGVKSQ